MSVWVYQKNKNIKPGSETKEESGTKGGEGGGGNDQTETK